MTHFLLTYTLSPEYLDRRGEHRAEHLRLAWDASQRGELVLGGAVSDPPTSAVLLFTGDGPDAAEAFARADPYVTSGIVVSWVVQPWVTVVGDQAASPVRL
jgi:uncharacterized protein YciI